MSSSERGPFVLGLTGSIGACKRFPGFDIVVGHPFWHVRDPFNRAACARLLKG